MNITPKYIPVLDPDFVAPVLWTRAYQEKVAATPGAHRLDMAMTRLDGTCFRWSGTVLPHEGENVALNRTYVERIVKFLLWTLLLSALVLVSIAVLGRLAPDFIDRILFTSEELSILNA